MATIQPTPRTAPRRRIGPRSAGMLMTLEEFDATPPSRWDDRFRYELIRGVLVVSPPVGVGEGNPNDELGYLLRTYRDSIPDGSSFLVTVPERTVPTTENRRRCDRAIWVGLGRVPDPDVDVPTIVIEFVSGSFRDRVRDYEEKRVEYLAAGVSEYWIIDRFRRVMTAHRRESTGGEFARQVVTEAQTYGTPLLPGFALPLARLLGQADLFKKQPERGPSNPL